MYSQKMYFCARTLVQLKPFLTLIFFFMKTKLLLLLAMCIGMTSSAWALEKDGDVYQISSAQDLADFAALVNGGETTASAVLTGDIDMSTLESWTAIGDWNTGAVSSAYCGHFDGQGFTIKGFNFTSSHNYYGIFGVVSTGCLIENFTIYGTLDLGHKTGGVVGYTRDATPTIRNIHSYVNINVTEAATTAQRPGGIVGSAVNGTTVIENCTYSGVLDVKEHTGNIGGIVGYVNNNTAAIVNITNCLFDGEIKNGSTADGQCGGFIGYSNKGKVTIKNCLSIGSITSSEGNVGQFFGRLNTSNSIFASNNYYVGEFVNGTSSGANASGTAPVKVTAEQLKSGEVAYSLNGNQSENVNWFQNLKTNGYPVPYCSDILYLTGHLHCDGTAYEGETAYSNEAAALKDDHSFSNGFCSYCGFPDEKYMTVNTDGYFEIGTANQLKWFSAYVNQINPEANAVLTADIDLKNVAWNPIGKASSKYIGSFDGQGHAITNFSYTSTSDGAHGFFGYVRNATIKNFSISGTLTSDGGTKGNNFTGTIGAAEANTVISGIRSSLSVNVSNCAAHSGGILGSTVTGGNPVLVEKCEYNGILTHSGTGDCQAGILGYTYDGGVKNCIFSGTIIGESSKYGGILGYCKVPDFLGVQNCLSIGKINANEENTTAAAIIANWNGNATVNVKNNYYCLQDGSSTTIAIGNKASSCEAPVSVTAEQLGNGEVTAKLGIAFRQNLEDEGESKKDPCPVIPMTDDDLLEHDVVVEITEAGYATLYIPDVDVVADEIKAFTGEINGEKLELIPVKDKTSGVCFIPAQTAVILKGAPGIYSLIPGFGAAKIEGNVLKGSAEDVEATGKYVLAKPEDGEVGFYLASGGTIKAGKAYLELPATEVKAFYFNGEDATGINGLNDVNDLNDAAIYNVAGQRVSKLQKGINIVNGKKVLK